jgi:hypothetical protein
MEIFIDLAKLNEGQANQPLPGIDLNLSGLVNFNKPADSPEVSQKALKAESEITYPNFNPIEYFGQIQAEFDKIRLANESKSIKDDTKVFQAAQQNSNTALDPIASYLESRFNKIETLTSNKEEIQKLIMGQSDTRLSEIQTIISKDLVNVEATDKNPSTEAVNKSITGLVDSLTSGGKNPEGPGMVILSDQKTKELIQQQDVNINTTADSISNLSETISNFATNVINGNSPNQTSTPAETVGLPELKKEPLSMVQEATRPDFGAASLSALMQLSDNTKPVAASENVSNTTTSQYNTTTVSQSATGPSELAPAEPANPGTIVMQNGSQDNSSVYLMQMLNFIKSGQLKVKIQ